MYVSVVSFPFPENERNAMSVHLLMLHPGVFCTRECNCPTWQSSQTTATFHSAVLLAGSRPSGGEGHGDGCPGQVLRRLRPQPWCGQESLLWGKETSKRGGGWGWGVIDAVLGIHPWFGGGGLGGRGEGLKRAALRCGREGREEEIHNMKVT